MTREIFELSDLKTISPEDRIRIYGLNLDAQSIRADSVVLHGCTGGRVGITARWVTIESSCLTSVVASVTEGLGVQGASADRIVIPVPTGSVQVNHSNIRYLQMQTADTLYVSTSWIYSLNTDSVGFVSLSQSYIWKACCSGARPTIHSRDTAIGCTNWPFADGGTDSRGYRVNVFHGARFPGSTDPVAYPWHLDGSEPTVVITAGCRAFVSVDEALRHWERNTTGMLPLVKQAMQTLKTREEARHDPPR